MFKHAANSPASLTATAIMTAHVICTTTDASVQSAAQLLRDHHVGALPVLDSAGKPVGMVSDGDLLGRRVEQDRGEWWLEMLARGAPPADLSGAIHDRPVHAVMTTPLITVGPHTPVTEIARSLLAHRIKRLPVVESDRLVGIVSRTDLLDLVERLPTAEADQAGGLFGAFGRHRASLAERLAASAATKRPEVETKTLSATGFRDLVEAYKHEKLDAAAKARHAAELERQRQVKTILEQRVSGEFWQQLLDHAELAAKHGEKELLLLRFPADVCSDGGRKINIVEEGWTDTLRGEAAEIYARWANELKPKGFGLDARVLSFENGVIGDFGLFLTWNS
ncbi:MAG TPA: CBS domain-containing protein [Acetobacteraceae bacterium]|nr:CBS domain-containing protein [Acetobacteraceae bacterium]